MRQRLAIAAIAGLVAMAAIALAQPTLSSYLPLISLPPAPALPAPDAASARLSVAPGYAVRLYASGLSRPRLMAVGHDGALYVAERGAGRIVRLADADRDGLADASEVVADGLAGVHSLAWHVDALYAAGNGSVWRLRDSDFDGTFSPAEVTPIVSGLPSDGGHSTRTARVGPDGMLYVAVGSRCNITVGCSEGDPRRAAILRYTLDGGIPADNPFAGDADPRRRPVWAAGLRNSVDFLFTPDGRLWATHNGSDGLGNDLPPEEIVIEVARGGHHGWPYCYTASLGAVPAGAEEVRDPRVPLVPGELASCAAAVPAAFTDGAHQAPLGIAQLPGGDLLVAYHGSWNADQTPRDCRVQLVRVIDGRPAAGEPFLTGFRAGPQQECGAAWGRPAGVAVAGDGTIFISDDQNGSIYRIIAAGS